MVGYHKATSGHATLIMHDIHNNLFACSFLYLNGSTVFLVKSFLFNELFDLIIRIIFEMYLLFQKLFTYFWIRSQALIGVTISSHIYSATNSSYLQSP